MKDHLLFIDTETSGLPKNWSLPYNVEGNWPYCVQIAWVLYDNKGRQIKEENHYIKDVDFEVSKSAIKVHGITHEFLETNGENRKEVMKLLAEDVIQFQPLIVGHFMEFDLEMLGADFYRSGMENPVKKEFTYCTMQGTKHLVKNPTVKFLRLSELYKILFNKDFENNHNAIADARATAECFFDLLSQNEITEEEIKQQQIEICKKKDEAKDSGCMIPLLVIISLTILIFYYL